MYQLREYQKRGIEFICKSYRSMLHVWMSLGKSTMVLHAIKYLFNWGRVYGVLIVGPLEVIESVWEQEAHSKNWPALNDIKFSKITGAPEQRLAALQKKGVHVWLINYENLKWLIPWLKHIYLNRGKRLPFNMIVFDEVRRMANIDTKRWEAISKIIQYFNYRIGMTGTPSTKGLLDLFGQYLIIDDGRSLGSHIGKFRSTYFRAADRNEYNYEVLPGMDNVIYQKIAPITFSLNGNDYMELPEVSTYDIWRDLPADLMEMYDNFEKSLLVMLSNGESLSAPNAAAAKTKCQQIANGAVYTSEDRNSWEEIHSIKLDLAEQIVSEANGNPMIVAYQFNSDRARLEKRLKPYGFVVAGSRVSKTDNKKIRDAWNHGDLPGMITHSASFGHGLNLQFGGHRQLWYGVTWSLDQYMQMIHRLRRPHQASNRVIIQRIFINNTVDVAMRLRLEFNDYSQQALWEAMRIYMEKKYNIGILKMRA